MNTTVKGIGTMLGDYPTSKKVLQVAAQMLREDNSSKIVRNNIFTLQFYMGTVAACAEFNAISRAFDSISNIAK